MTNISQLLQDNQHQFGRVLAYDYRQSPVYVFDLTDTNQELRALDRSDVEVFSAYMTDTLQRNACPIGIGRYNEDRNIYTSDLFTDENVRTIHLGIDLRTAPGTEIFCPYEGTVHSFANNAARGDYGPTIILQHVLDNHIFYTLYGHLSLDSLDDIQVGTRFQRGDIIGRIGNYPINGNWPPHLHFEIIEGLEERSGDYPGVCSRAQREYYLRNCPNPNLILQILGL